MQSTHIKVKHADRERTLSESRAKYWIVGGRKLAKEIIHDCVLCRKTRQQPQSTLMGSLPPERLEVQSPPFTGTGVDLFGPFLLKYGRNKSIKAWGANFARLSVQKQKSEVFSSKERSSCKTLQSCIRFVGSSSHRSHQGGMYESLIKVTKRALRVTVGEQILSWNEMAIVFAEVKSISSTADL